MWRRPLEWNLNGTTDPRDGSVDHLSLNSLRDRHGPIRAPKSRQAAIGGCHGRARSCGESSVPLSFRSPRPANRPSVTAPVEAWSTLEAVSGTPSLHSDGFKLIEGASDVKSVMAAGRLKVRARRWQNSGFPVQDRMPKVDRSRFIRQLTFDWFWRPTK